MSGSRVGVDLGGTKIHGIVLEADGRFSASQRVATPRDDYAGTLDAISELVAQLDPSGRLPVGIGTPGSWLSDRQVMQNCNSTWLNGRPLLHDLSGRLGARVRIANDADCFALSEAHGGAGDAAGTVFGVILGTGVGGGVVVQGKLLEGANGIAGEWGHNPLPRFPAESPAGLESALEVRACYCGRRNCVETFLSGPGLSVSHRQLWGTVLSAKDIHEAARLDVVTGPWWQNAPIRPGGEAPPEAAARASLALYTRQLARALAQIVNVLDPDVIVLGGGLSNMRAIYEPTRELLCEEVFAAELTTRIVAPRFGDSGGVRGAAWLWGAGEQP